MHNIHKKIKSNYFTAGSACLHIAARFGHLTILAFLLAKGENVDLEASNGMTALMWSSYMAYGYDALWIFSLLQFCHLLINKVI